MTENAKSAAEEEEKAARKRAKEEEERLAKRKRKLLLGGGVFFCAVVATILSKPLEWEIFQEDPDAMPESYEVLANPNKVIEMEDLLNGRSIDDVSMVEASRIYRWKLLQDRPVRRVLNNSRDAWYIYKRLHPQEAAAIVARAAVSYPDEPEDAARLDFRHLLRSILQDIDKGRYTYLAEFLQYLALLNGEVASLLISETAQSAARAIPAVFRIDDFILRLGVIHPSLRSSYSGAWFHPGLTRLTLDCKRMLVEQLTEGWVSKEERELAEYIQSLIGPEEES
tara:strand:+ start:58 stop:903 length:846 start_codon:yes stop_codon:yes gene_type:complete